MIPQGFGMLKEVFAEDEMGKVFGAFGPVMGLSMLAAPVLAGVLVEANLWGVGWRLVFLINVPIGIATFARRPPRPAAHRRPPRHPPRQGRAWSSSASP